MNERPGTWAPGRLVSSRFAPAYAASASSFSLQSMQ